MLGNDGRASEAECPTGGTVSFISDVAKRLASE